MIKTGALRHGAKHRGAASRAALNADRRFYDPMPWFGFDVAMSVPPGFEALKEAMEEAKRHMQEVMGMPALMQAERPPTTGAEIQARVGWSGPGMTWAEFCKLEEIDPATPSPAPRTIVTTRGSWRASVSFKNARPFFDAPGWL